MFSFKKWLNEVGGTNWGEPPKQCPYDPEHPERGAFHVINLDRNDLPPAKRKYGRDRFRMKKG